MTTILLTNDDGIDSPGSIHFTRFFAEHILRKGMPMGADVLKVEVPASHAYRMGRRVTLWKRVLKNTFTAYIVDHVIHF
jgi:broad specificity polyphosphatase/5'/3'-nucleotidase SurE